MSHLGARHHQSRIEQVRYLLESSRVINLCCVSCGYLGNTEAQPDRRALQTERALASVPALLVTTQQVLPMVSRLEPVPCPLQRARCPPQPRGPEKNQDPITKHSKRRKGSVSQMTVTGISVAGIGSSLQSFTATQAIITDPPSTPCGCED